MDRLRVWVVSPELHRHGGTERSVAEQVERWRGRFDLALYTMRATDVDLRGVRVRRVWRPPGPEIARFLWWLVANAVARRWDIWHYGAPHVVYSPGVNCFDARAISVHIVFAKFWERLSTFAVYGARRAKQAPRAAHRLLLWGVARLLERRIYSGPATLWAVSREDAAELERRYHRPNRSVPVIPSGVDSATFSPHRRQAVRDEARTALALDGKTVLLLVGNDWRKKGLDIAIRALQWLPERFEVAAAGRDTPLPFLKVAQERGVAKRVRFWEHRADVLYYYAAADCLVAPSREDAFHMPVLEAMACGLPVTVSVQAGVAELIEDGRHALLLPDAEDDRALARQVLRLCDEPGVAARLVTEGRALAERCSWDVNAERAAAVIEREIIAPRVLVLATDPWGVGGIERSTRTLIRSLADLYGPERVGLISVWGVIPEDAALSCRVLHAGSARPTARRNHVGLWSRVRTAAATVMAARRWRGTRTVIIACHPHLAPLAWLCRLVSGAPVAVWCHGFEVWGRVRPLVGAALRRCNRIVAVSNFTASQLIQATRAAQNRIQVLRHALAPEVRSETGGNGGSPEVLSVARLDPEHSYKGIDTLIRAWPAVAAQVPGARLTVVGEGADRGRLEALAGSVGPGIRFVGRVGDDELARLYGTASIFCLPARAHVGRHSSGEGFGLVYLEAGAAGLAVVAGRAGGAPEAVVDGTTGVLVDPESSDAVAAALVRLLGDRELAHRMGEAGREFVGAHFSYDRFRADVADLVSGLILESGGPGR